MRRKVHPEILQAAIKLFGAHSYKGVTTRALAKEARVAEPAIYLHFRSKERLYQEAVNAAVAEVSQQFSQFVLYLFEDASLARIAEGVRRWYASIPDPEARLVLQVLISDNKRRSNASEPLDQMISAVAKSLASHTKANREFNRLAAARSLIHSLFWTKVFAGRNAALEMEEAIQVWLLHWPAVT